jgi:hypothetical protein
LASCLNAFSAIPTWMQVDMRRSHACHESRG